MRKWPNKKWCLRLVSLVLVFLLVVPMLGCEGSANVTVNYFDADGTLIETQRVKKDYDPTERLLPEDTDAWHYTGWSISKSGTDIVCTATRKSKTKLIWKDFDGTVLEEGFVVEGEVKDKKDLPESNERWNYTSWSEQADKGEIIYTAGREPNISYFYGNVFQIVIKDKSGEPLGVGSGFVINEDGWFITNNHVMEDAYTASAFFDIRDENSGTKHTTLDIIGGVYNDEKKDIFIGKLAGYEKIRSHYKKIVFTEEYAEGDTCSAIGYPNAAISLEYSRGKVLEEYSDIRDKINGVYYLLSDCYIAPGSSGGILVNENYEVIGITSIGLYADAEKTELISGGSVPTLAFKEQLDRLQDSLLKSLDAIYGIK